MLTKTSITRATAQLKAMGLIRESKAGTEISIMRNCPKKEYYLRAKKYLINPVQKIITVKTEVSVKNELLAGESALSKITELNAPGILERAIFKGEVSVKQFNIPDARFEEQGTCANV